VGGKGNASTNPNCIIGNKSENIKIPNFELADLPESKILDYLLSENHEEGWGKAKFFKSIGFTIELWEDLAIALKLHGVENSVAKIEEREFGTRYVVEGPLKSPSGRTVKIRSVWFIATDTTHPRFTTAYPLKDKVYD